MRLPKILILQCIVCLLTLLLIGCRQTTVTSTTTTEERTTSMTSDVSTTTSANLIERIDLLTESPVANQMVEFGLIEQIPSAISEQYNPYDYNQIKVEMIFHSPSGDTLKQNAFWFKEYEEIRLIGEQVDEFGFYTAGQELVTWKEDGTSLYHVRITPDAEGAWNYTMNLLIDGEVTETMDGSFTVGIPETEEDGFIRVDPVNGMTFTYDSGNSFIPIGTNLAWWSTTLSSHDYNNWFHKMSLVDANYARIWMANWSFSLHKDSYTNFDTRQSIAIRLDSVLQAADEYGVYIMLTLLNHGQFSSNTNPEWSENVYNQANGGMLEYPIQFFYNKEAKEAYKNELLYILARYGYSDNIFAWELFNEVDWIDGYSSIAVTSWHKEMSEFLHANDPYNHMVSTSYKYTWGTPAYALDSIDFVAVHSYAYGDVQFYSKLITETNSLMNQYQKPVFFGEIGIDWESGTSTYHSDYTGVTIKQGAWGGMMLGAASANHWWWDSWIAKYELWDRFLGAGVYALEIDLAGKSFSQLATDDLSELSSENAGIMGYLLADTIYGYLYHKSWNYWNRTPDAIENLSVQIPMANGNYRLTIYDTETGVVISDSTVEISNNLFELTGITLETDFAFILKKNS